MKPFLWLTEEGICQKSIRLTGAAGTGNDHFTRAVDFYAKIFKEEGIEL